MFRESAATWYISRSSGGTDIVGFGAVGDKPVNADYDGDGKSDIAIFRPNGPGGAEWWVRRSSNASVFALQFGSSTDKAVPGDFTGDGKADVAFWRPSTGFWNVLRSEDFSYYAFPFGANGDIAIAGRLRRRREARRGGVQAFVGNMVRKPLDRRDSDTAVRCSGRCAGAECVCAVIRHSSSLKKRGPTRPLFFSKNANWCPTSHFSILICGHNQS